MKNWFDNLPTKTKISYGMAPLILLVAVMGVIGLFSLWNIQRTSTWVNHTFVVLQEAEQIVGSAVDMETGMRGYLLAGKEEFLEPYASGEADTYKRIAELKKTVSDNPRQVARLGRIEQVLRDWQSNETEKQIQMRRDIGDAPTMNDISKLVGEARGKTYFDRFRKQVALFIEREEKLLSQRRTTYERSLDSGNVSSQQTKDAMKWVVHTYNVIGKANALLAAAIDMETGMRGYLLAGRDEFLEPYRSGQEQFFQIREDLARTVSDNPAQVKLLAEVDDNIRGWIKNVVTPMIELRTDIGDAKTMDDMADLVGQARGKEYFDQFRKMIADFSEEEERLMEVRQASRNSTMRFAVLGIFITMVVAIGVGLFLSLHIGESIGRPIMRITKSLQGLVQGKTDVKIDGQIRKDEVGKIARAAQKFKENAEKVEELVKADLENAKKLQEAADEQKRESELRAADERAARTRDAERQQMMEQLQDSISSVVAGAVVGDFSRRVDTGYRDPKLTELAELINNLMAEISTGLNATAGTLEKLAKGDINVRMNGNFKGAFGKLKDNLNNTIEQLGEIVGNISTISNAVGQNSAEISSGATTLSERAVKQAASIEESAAAMEEMTQTIKANAANSKVAQDLTQKSSVRTQEGVKIVEQVTSAVNEIEETSKEVASIVTLIESVAFQTNLLALNASVEAARAGSAGAGFAVVAGEVRQLAVRTSEASSDIQSLINATGVSVTKGVKLITEAGESLEAIEKSIGEVEAMVKEIVVASGEQAAGAIEINNSISAFDRLSQQNTSLAEDSENSAVALLNSAQELDHALSFFSGKNNVDKQADIQPLAAAS